MTFPTTTNPKISNILAIKNHQETSLRTLFRNLSETLTILRKERLKEEDDEGYRDDSHAYLYILFVLTFYAFSIIVLMVKYIKREREGNRDESYYSEFVKREWWVLYCKLISSHTTNAHFNMQRQNFH